MKTHAPVSYYLTAMLMLSLAGYVSQLPFQSVAQQHLASTDGALAAPASASPRMADEVDIATLGLTGQDR